MDLLRFVKELLAEQLDTPQGLYLGQVEVVDDPDKQGRVRVRVMGVHSIGERSDPPESLPWATVKQLDAGKNYGSFIPPWSIGDWVFVMFMGGDFSKPQIVGSYFGVDPETDESEIPEEVKQDYPFRAMLYKSRRGHRIEMCDAPKKLLMKLTDAAGNFILFDTETGPGKKPKLVEYFNGDRETIVTGNWTIRVDGDLTTVVGKPESELEEGEEQGNRIDMTHGNYDIISKKQVLLYGDDVTVRAVGQNDDRGGEISIVATANASITSRRVLDLYAENGVQANWIRGGQTTGSINAGGGTVSSWTTTDIRNSAVRPDRDVSRPDEPEPLKDPEDTIDGSARGFPDEDRVEDLGFVINEPFVAMDDLTYPPGRPVEPDEYNRG